METENVQTKRIVIEYTDKADLRKKLKAEEKALVGTRPFDVFRPVALCQEDMISINQKHSTAEKVRKIFNDTPEPLRIAYQDGTAKKRKGSIVRVYEVDIHDALRKLTLNVFGVTQNVHLKENQLVQAQEVYQLFKDVFLQKYDERLARIDKEKIENERINKNNK